MKRPPLFTASRQELIEYIEHVEAEKRRLESALDPATSAPKARRTDPSTSKKAAKRAHPRAGTHKHRILGLMAEHPNGLTAEEIGLLTGINGVWKRCSELHDDSYLYTHGERKTLSGDDARIYFISAKGRMALTITGRIKDQRAAA